IIVSAASGGVAIRRGTREMAVNSTYMAKKEQVERKWFVVDATDKVLGRLAAQVAMILQGKNKPTYTPHVDTGDFVVVVNADKIKITGRKLERKYVYRHSGYKGGLKATSYGTFMEKYPDRLFERVVKGMLPKNRLHFEKKLKVYAGPEHPHTAQKPEPLEI
ncbi:MAG: 50S ribosomal protein L13, partial [Synergistales bacterium 58_81]